jgi:ferrous iron transport protein B
MGSSPFKAQLEQLINLNPDLNLKYPGRWLAVKLLEGDERLRTETQKCQANQVLAQASQSINHLINILGDELEAIIAERRYGFISGLLKEVVSRRSSLEERLTISDKIDRVVTNRFLGLPLFLLAGLSGR